MRRVDRLFQIIQLLRRNRVVTAQEISRKLGVSVRTVYRDIDHLSVSGVPIMSERGVGYRMKGGFDLPPLSFDADELKALRLGARMVRAWADPALRDAAERMLDKIDAVLTPEQQAVLQDAPLFALDFFLEPEDAEMLRVIREAAEGNMRLRLTYSSVKDEVTERVIWPLGAFYSGGKWLVGAWCELREGFRNFLLSGVLEAYVLGPVEDPDPPSVDDFIADQERKSGMNKPN